MQYAEIADLDPLDAEERVTPLLGLDGLEDEDDEDELFGDAPGTDLNDPADDDW
jgi:hypothetical protein